MSLFAELDEMTLKEESSDCTSEAVTTKFDTMMVTEAREMASMQANVYGVVQMIETSKTLEEAVYMLANYTPAKTTGKSEQTWSEIHKQLQEALQEDTRFRNQMCSSFGAINDLATIINTCGALIKKSKGSEKAIAVAKRLIPVAVERIKEAKAELQIDNKAAIKLFAKDSKTILECVGVKALTDSMDDLNVLEEQRDAIALKIKQITLARAEAKAEYESRSNFLAATEMRVHGPDIAISNAKQRQEELHKMIEAGERELDSIPMTTTEETTSRIFWFRSVTKRYQVKNPDLDAQRDHLNSIIIARTKRLQETAKTVEEKKMTLEKDILKQKKEVAKAKYQLEAADDALKKELPKLQKEMARIEQDIMKIKTAGEEASEKFGLNGRTLINCITAYKKIGVSGKAKNEAFMPLVNVLSWVIHLVEGGVEMLSGTEADVFVGGSQLLESVGSLRETSATFLRMLSDKGHRDRHLKEIGPSPQGTSCLEDSMH